MSNQDLFITVQRALAGHYSIERELGRGGMAVVFLAREVELDRFVALKVLPPERACDPDLRERFLREARTAASLSHPNVVPIYRVGELNGIVFFSMAYVAGETLGERLRGRGPMTPAATTRMLREVGQALAYAHGRGIIHRDIKPDNILLDGESGRAIVTDFGIASVIGALSDAHTRAGTPFFASPEQRTGASPDARSDIYSLGVVAYLAISGRLPAERISEDGERVRAASIVTIAPVVPGHLAQAIDRAISRSPQRRFTTAEQFVEAVEPRAPFAKLPESLRQWLEARDPWAGAYLLWVGVFTIGSLKTLFDIIDRIIFHPTLTPTLSSLLLQAAIQYGIAAAPLIPALTFQARRARKLFEEGFTTDDLRYALKQLREARYNVDGEQSKRDGQVARWAGGPVVSSRNRESVARALAWGGIAFVLLLPGVGGPVMMYLSMVLVIVALPLLTAMDIPLLPGIPFADGKGFSAWFWNSRLGKFAEKFLMRGRKVRPPASAFRPTESVLSGAIEHLYNSLPTAYRRQLPDVLDVIARLRSHASRARAALVNLEMADAGLDARLMELRDRARNDLGESVAALEAIRLDLLRLHGGDADLRPSTTVLDAARRIDSDLRRLQEAQREVDLIVPPLGLDLRPNSPA